MASGGKGYSHAQNMPAIGVSALPAGFQLLNFEQEIVTLNRGTYARDAVCVEPGVAGENFQGDFTFTTTSSAFKTVPAEIKAKMGDANACGDLGAASSTAATLHWTYWKVTGDNMSPLAAVVGVGAIAGGAYYMGAE